MITKDGRIIISEWERAIGASSAQGFADMRSCDPFRKPGYLELSLEMVNEMDTPVASTTFTANTNDTITVASTFRRGNINSGNTAEARAVTVSNSGGALPAGLSAGTIYYIKDTGATTMELSTILNANGTTGAAVKITDTGTGTHSMVTVNMGTPRYIVNDEVYTRLWLQDSNGRLWVRDTSAFGYWLLASGNTLTAASGNGLVIWKGYLFVFREAILDYYLLSQSVLANPAANPWTAGVAFKSSLTLNIYAGDFIDHHPFVHDSGRLYFLATSASTVAGTNAVGYFVENTTFDPASGSTFTYSAAALDKIPGNITCFESLVNDLAIGTDTNRIFVWDRQSSSWNKTITLHEPYTQCMRSLNNILYFSSGVNGNIYQTYGTTVEKFLDLADEYLNSVRYGAVVKKISFDGNEMTFWLNASDQTESGIYSVDKNTRAVHLKYQPSLGDAVTIGAGTSFLVLPGGISASGTISTDVVFAGYNTGGVTYVDSNFAYGSVQWMTTRYAAYCITPLYEVGTFENPKTYQKVQIQLARPLLTGQGVKVESRTNLTAAFSNAATFDYATIGGVLTAFESVANVETTQFIQFKISMTSSSSAPTVSGTTNYNYDTPQLKSVIVY